MPKVVLKNARLSFPSLFKTEVYQGTDTGKYAASFLVPKDSKQAKALTKAVNEAIKEKWGKDAPKKLPVCVKDGDEETYDGYEGMVAVKAGTKRRPVLLNQDKSAITDDDGTLYAGCYVNASIDVYAYEGPYGKRISAQLNGIQFAKDGEPFGGSSFDIDDFDDISDEDDDDDLPF